MARGRRGGRVPGMHDITTDTINPPEFVDVLPHRRWALNSPTYGGPQVAARQRAAYPDIQPLLVEGTRAHVHAVARDLMTRAGWTVVGDDEAAGRLEAIAVTSWLRFRDDVVVRLTATPDGRTRVDMRSKSRVGRSDLGVNARRIRGFLAQLAEALDARTAP